MYKNIDNIYRSIIKRQKNIFKCKRLESDWEWASHSPNDQ